MSFQGQRVSAQSGSAVRWIGLWTALCLAVGGCGRATYEKRLEQTIALANYREKLNQNLTSPEWNQKGVKFRAPLQFKAINPPAPPKKEGEVDPDAAPPEDPRQPKFLDVPLPGLIGAWQAEVDVLPAEGKPAGTASAYIYILSNFDMWRQKGQGEQASTFNGSIAPAAVVDGLRAKMPEQAEWVAEGHPRKGGFVATNNFTAAMVKSSIDIAVTRAAAGSGDGEEGTGSQIETVDVNCKMYLRENGDMQVMVVVIVPEQIDPQENLDWDTLKKKDSRIAMALETLVVSGTKPRPDSGGSGGPGGGGGRGETF